MAPAENASHVSKDGGVAKIKKSRTRIVSLLTPESGTSIISKANNNPRSSLVRVAHQRGKAIVMKADVLIAASSFLKKSALLAKVAREEGEVLTLGEYKIRCVPVIEFEHISAVDDPCSFVDAEQLATSLDYVDTSSTVKLL